MLGERLTQAKFDQLLVRLELNDEISLGAAKSVTAKSAQMAHLVQQRPTQVVHTLEGPMTLAEAAVREAVLLCLPLSTSIEQARLLRGLALDGYVICWTEEERNPLLRAALPAGVNLPAADDEVHQLLRKFGFLVSLGHLDQAIDAHARGDWAAANSQVRTFLEGLLDEISRHIDPKEASALPSSENRRAWLADRQFLSIKRNEWTGDGKNFINGLFKMLHTEGSHPGLSTEDHCTFRLHLGLMTSRVLLRRLDNAP